MSASRLSINPSRLFIARPVASALLAVALLLVGMLGYRLLPVAPLPQVDFPTIQITASLPGASPETMASSVAMPLERSFGNISGVTQIWSASNQGNTQVVLQFDLDKNLNDAAREVQAAINTVRNELPSGMPGNPVYRKLNPSQAPVLVLALSSPSRSAAELYDLAESVLAQKISQIGGVGEVQLGGGSLPAVRVELQPRALNQYGIALDQVRQAIAGANAPRPKGELEQGATRWQIGANDQLLTASEYRQLLVSDVGRQPVRLGDVATVSDSVENRRAAGFHNHQPAVVIQVNRQPDANVIATVDAIQAQLPGLRALLPSDVVLEVTSDRTPGIRATLHEAERTLLISVVLVVAVVLLFLGNLRAALIPTLAVPVSLIGSFALLYLFGFSLNNLSLMALIVVAGLVVDDAIVVMENISRHIEAGASPLRAALRGSREVGFTLLAMNLALMVVFFAILFMGGFIERLFREFSLTLIAAITLSLLVSLSLTPSLCARLLSRTQHEPMVGTRWFARLFARTQRGYASSLQWALRHARLVLVLLIAVIGLNVYLYVTIPKSFLPQQDTGQLMGFVRGDDSLSYQAMQPKMESFRQHLLKDPAVADVVGFVGGSGGINNAFLMIRLKPLAERGIVSQQVLDRMRASLPVEPGARLMMFVTQDITLGSHRGRGTEHRLLLQASELELLREWGPRVARAMADLPELTDVDGRFDEGALQVELSIDRVAARRLGVDVDTVTQVLNNSFSQRQVTTLFNALNQYRVVLEIDPAMTENPTVLDEVQVITADGRRVPLAAFASYRYTTASDRIQHEGQFAADNIGFNLAEGVSLAEGMQAIDRALAEVMLPNSVQARLADAGAQLAAIQGEQPLLLLGVILVVYIVLGILYESFTHPLTILSTLPSAGVGALLALQLLDTEFSLIALLGLFLLIGVVMKNAILIIDVALDAERRRGLPPAVAVFEAAQQRFRPILMTTLAAICGALPLMLGSGDGAELRQPLGIAIVGGLIVSQVLTLYTTPVVYLYLDRLRLFCLRKMRRDGSAATSTP